MVDVLGLKGQRWKWRHPLSLSPSLTHSLFYPSDPWQWLSALRAWILYYPLIRFAQRIMECWQLTMNNESPKLGLGIGYWSPWNEKLSLSKTHLVPRYPSKYPIVRPPLNVFERLHKLASAPSQLEVSILIASKEPPLASRTDIERGKKWSYSIWCPISPTSRRSSTSYCEPSWKLGAQDPSKQHCATNLGMLSTKSKGVFNHDNESDIIDSMEEGERW